jgi:hypothetical protein
MGPRRGREDKTPLVEEPQEVIVPTDEVECREHSGDEFYETPVDFEGYYHDQIPLRD